MKLSKIYSKLYTVFTQKPCIKVLKKNGLTVGKNLNIQNGAIIDVNHCFLITIGDNCTLAPNCHILAHDASTKKFIGYTKVGKVTIGNNVIIGANSVVSKNIDDNSVVAGNPAKIISSLSDYLNKYKNINEDVKFDESYTIDNGVSDYKKSLMAEKIDEMWGLVK